MHIKHVPFGNSGRYSYDSCTVDATIELYYRYCINSGQQYFVEVFTSQIFCVLRAMVSKKSASTFVIPS